MSSENKIDGDGVDSSTQPEDTSLGLPVHTAKNDLGVELNEFRDNWQREIMNQHDTQLPAVEEQQQQQVDGTHSSNSLEIEQQTLAESLFREAVELEQRGKVYDALPLYRKALQIDPDIELHFYEHQKLKIPTNMEMKSAPIQDDTINEEDFIADLYEKFQLDISRDYGGKLILSSRDSGVITTEMHLSDLPPEIILYILRWVISTQLDMRSLEQCAAVCKGLYICARDDDLWRLACLKVWGVNVGTPSNPGPASTNQTELDDETTCTYSAWRQMFIDRERVLFSGCYISKTTYLRMGENSFQDQFYRPVQLVEYYRYIRFLPDGTVLMMTNADEPSQGVGKLRNLQQIRNDVLRGRYRLNDGMVTIFMTKQQRINNVYQHGRSKRTNNAAMTSKNCTEYCIEFRIMSSTKRKFAQLVWVRYTVVQTRNSIETTSEFELVPSKYPPLWFSPVRSYHLDAEAPLT